MNGLAILFAIPSFSSLLALPVALFRPGWLRMKSRLTAVFTCLYTFTGFAGIGMWLDPEAEQGFNEAFALVAAVGFWHLIFLGARKLTRKSKTSKTPSPIAHRSSFYQEGKPETTIIVGQSVQPTSEAEVKKSAGSSRKVATPQASDDVMSAEKLAEFEESLTTIWAGDAKTVEFTYEKPFGRGRSRRRVDVEELMYYAKGRIILRGHCHERGEERTFREDRILTKIKTGSKRYDFDEWCEELLGVDLYDVVPVR
ncbi:WYL domain-containing protein [Oceanimonas smirnovii]|uniref:WYL domain-containing protein n=1 Tax=Oceanimonas smirnovii TaxID=264574 RepID=UPI003FD1B9CD